MVYLGLSFLFVLIFFMACQPPVGQGLFSLSKLHDHTQTHTTLGRTPLDERSARHRDFYLTTHSSHKRQTSMTYGNIRTRNPSQQAAADLRLRPRGQWDRFSGASLAAVCRWLYLAESVHRRHTQLCCTKNFLIIFKRKCLDANSFLGLFFL
jgi:hypothetical protein